MPCPPCACPGHTASLALYTLKAVLSRAQVVLQQAEALQSAGLTAYCHGAGRPLFTGLLRPGRKSQAQLPSGQSLSCPGGCAVLSALTVPGVWGQPGGKNGPRRCFLYVGRSLCHKS